MYLEWSITDLEQTVLADNDDLANRLPGGKVTIPMPQHNGGRTASLPLSVEDPVCSLIAAYECCLRVTLLDPDDSEHVVFLGRVGVPKTEASSEGGTKTLQAVDAWHQLENSVMNVDSGFAVVGGADAFNQSEYIWELIRSHAGDGHGVAEGSLDASAPSEGYLHGSGSTVAAEILRYVTGDDGPDISLDPIAATNGDLVGLNTYHPRQGSDLTASVIFTYGQGDETAVAFTHEPATPCNKFLAIGQNVVTVIGGEDVTSPGVHYAYLAQHNASVAAIGEWMRSGTVDTDNAAELAAVAVSEVAMNAYPIEWFTLTSAPLLHPDSPATEGDGPPVFGPDHDYWVGDTIALNARTYGPDGETVNEDFTLEGRVLQGAYVERDTGQLDVEIECAPEGWAAGVSGAADTVWVDEGATS